MTRGWLVFDGPIINGRQWPPIKQATLPGDRLAWLWAHEQKAHEQPEYSGNYFKPTHNELCVLVKTRTIGMLV